VRKESVILREEPDLPGLRRQADAPVTIGPGFFSEPDQAAIGPLQSCQTPEDRRLSSPGRSEQNGDGIGGEVHGEAPRQ
jgi:hypothetical protein